MTVAVLSLINRAYKTGPQGSVGELWRGLRMGRGCLRLLGMGQGTPSWLTFFLPSLQN